MKKHTISGIQQIGVGCENFKESWQWYIDHFGIDVKILEDNTVAERMLPYTGGVPQRRHAGIAISVQGGSGFEIWQYSDRKPQKADFLPAIGDLGIFGAKIRCRNVLECQKQLAAKYAKTGHVVLSPDGKKSFWVVDPWDNCFQFVEDDYIYIDQNRLSSGICGALIGVSDMESSIAFYRDVLGYDKVISDQSGKFNDWEMLPGFEENYRRVLLTSTAKPQGGFSALFGPNSIELVQALDRTPRKIYEGRYWGDPGFIQVCYDVTNMNALGEFCASKGHPFTVDSCPNNERFDMGEASGRFTYIEDPDGTLIEFVETEKIPILKKMGIYLDMTKRDRTKEIPKFLMRLLALTKVKTVK
ncbi:MAG: VOC family protein [Bacteroidales bacterium]|nr:VOC family protein [Bacteroidales bacterium]